MSAVSQRAEQPLGARPWRARMADPAFFGTLAAIAALVLVLIVFFFIFLFDHARPALAHQGVLSFVFSNDWNPSKEIYGGWPLLAGTIITSAIALVLGVPVAVAAALFTTELAPPRLRGPLSALVEMLAA